MDFWNTNDKSAQRTIVRNDMEELGVPEHLRAGIEHYLIDHEPFGHFLQAVVSNDLFEAVGRADEKSMAGLKQLVVFFFNRTPRGSHGSRRNLESWLAADSFEDWLEKEKGESLYPRTAGRSA